MKALRIVGERQRDERSGFDPASSPNWWRCPCSTESADDSMLLVDLDRIVCSCSEPLIAFSLRMARGRRRQSSMRCEDIGKRCEAAIAAASESAPRDQKVERRTSGPCPGVTPRFPRIQPKYPATPALMWYRSMLSCNGPAFVVPHSTLPFEHAGPKVRIVAHDCEREVNFPLEVSFLKAPILRAPPPVTPRARRSSRRSAHTEYARALSEDRRRKPSS